LTDCQIYTILLDSKGDAKVKSCYLWKKSWFNLFCTYEGCPKSKCTDFLFKYLLDSPEITSYLLQSM